MTSRLSLLAVAAMAALCFATPALASGRSACGQSGYSYAGVSATRAAHGIGAVVTMRSRPVVHNGHVAGWVGVGGGGLGPGGTDAWLQVGISAYPGRAPALYVEFARAGETHEYVPLGPAATGRAYRLAVLELARRPGWWQAWLDGRAVAAPVFLGRGVASSPVATAESWDDHTPICNRFDFAFSDVRVAGRRGGSWSPLARAAVLEDSGYRVVRRSPSAFRALARAA